MSPIEEFTAICETSFKNVILSEGSKTARTPKLRLKTLTATPRILIQIISSYK